MQKASTAIQMKSHSNIEIWNKLTKLWKRDVQRTWMDFASFWGARRYQPNIFIYWPQIPAEKKGMCIWLVCETRPQKTESHIASLIEGRNLIKYLGYVSTPTADIKTLKIHCNSIIYEEEANTCVYMWRIFTLSHTPWTSMKTLKWVKHNTRQISP